VGNGKRALFQESSWMDGKAPRAALFVWLISHQPTVLFSQNKPAISNQPTVLFSQNKPAPAISHQPNEQAGSSAVVQASLEEESISER
jgi:hypothetical protein